MKPAYESIDIQSSSTSIVRKFEQAYFTSGYHFHPEFELTYIVKGQGRRFVGNHIASYTQNDLVLLGENLPHCWKSADTESHTIHAVSIVLQFRRDFLGKEFFRLPEMKSIDSLLTASKNGIKFSEATAQEVAPLMIALKAESNAVRRVGRILDLLDRLSRDTEFVILENGNIYEHINLVQREKINRIQAFIVDHFQENIGIEEAAALINMTAFGFCKYFKGVTRRTFMETVINYRIEYAINQLLRTDHSITEIAFESGFNDLSNFFKTFQRKKNMSPLQYRKSLL